MDDRVRSSILQFFSNLPALLGSNTLYTLDNDKNRECDIVKQLQSTALNHSFVLAPPTHEIAQPPHRDRPTLKRPKMTEINRERNALHPLAPAVEEGSFLEGHLLHSYGTKAPRLGNVHSLSVRKKKLPSRSMMTGCLSSKGTGARPHKEGAMFRTESLEEVKSVTSETPTASGAPQLEAESIFQVLKVVLRHCLFVRDSSLNKPEDRNDKETGSSLHQNVN